MPRPIGAPTLEYNLSWCTRATAGRLDDIIVQPSYVNLGPRLASPSLAGRTEPVLVSDVSEDRADSPYLLDA
ncbi:MAG: hypothetical protein VYC82_05845 [Verrucomicrobiota bacterium]|nr:hypothetical protein [Verrucomicrobiota bacterium]